MIKITVKWYKQKINTLCINKDNFNLSFNVNQISYIFKLQVKQQLDKFNSFRMLKTVLLYYGGVEVI